MRFETAPSRSTSPHPEPLSRGERGLTTDPRTAIRDKALSLAFDAVGFAPASLDAPTRRHLRDFLAAGWHGDMGWLAAKADRRQSPDALWPEARSVVALGLSYAPADDPLARLARHDRGTIASYAQGRDYHDVVKARLKALARWIHEDFDAGVKVFVDTAPVMEKPLGQLAGLGWQGKHTNLVSRHHGSWLFLGEVYTTLDLEPDAPHADRCGTCTRCQAACPTDAFPEPYRLDARRCISYLTIEHKGPIPRDLRPAMGNRIYGCDDCLAVCPWNRFAVPGGTDAFFPRAELTAPRLADLAALDDASFRQVFAASPIKRTGRDRFVRNVLIALGNSGDAALAAAAEARLGDAAPLVRGAAVWALSRLLPAAAFAALAKRHRSGETDASVAEEWTETTS
jgi:epoxyqueuosine reductase